MAASLATIALAANADGPLFAKPLHILRRIEDPISHSTASVEEYCVGNRIITVSGERVAVVDYEKQELTEIDRSNSTYSITRFDDIAKAHPPTPAGRPAEWKATPLGIRSSSSNKSVDRFEFHSDAGEIRRIEIDIDREVTLSRTALEALIGAAYPNNSGTVHDAVFRAAGGLREGSRIASTASPSTTSLGLPTSQSITYEVDGTSLTVRNQIVRVDSALPPMDTTSIPPGSKRVESRLTRLTRELHELDRLPNAPRP